MLPLKPVVPSLWLPLYTFFSAQAEAEFAAFPAFPQPWEFQCGQDASEVPANPWIRTTLHARPIWHQEAQLGQRAAEVQAIPQQLSPSSGLDFYWPPLARSSHKLSSSLVAPAMFCSIVEMQSNM